MKKEMLINVLQTEECRIAIVEDGVLEELYVERASQENYVGNIYKGKVVNIEPSIQAAFVDFGVGRNGFLHVSDVDPTYYKHLLPRDVLARFEAEEEDGPPRNFGGRDAGRGRRTDRRDGGGDRDRGSRPPRDFADEPRRPVQPPPVDTSLIEDEGFGSGLVEDGGAPERPAPRREQYRDDPPARAPVARAEERPAPEPEVVYADESDDGFGAGLDVDDAGSGGMIEFDETQIEAVGEVEGSEGEGGDARPKARGRPEEKAG